MRMWNVPPKLMCDQHLLGEHFEMHMFAGSIKKGISLNGYIQNGEIVVQNISKRHEMLKNEMLKRGMKHHSPLRVKMYKAGKVDVKKNLIELSRRCKDCRRRINERS